MPTWEYRPLEAKVLLSYCATRESRVTATSICFIFLNWYIRHAGKILQPNHHRRGKIS